MPIALIRLWMEFSWYCNLFLSLPLFVSFELTRGFLQPDTTIAPGPTDVKDAYLMYNEYICYDVAQVRLRYLFQIKM